MISLINEEIENIEETEVEIVEEKAYDELMNKYQRALAEYDNFRKRTIKEKSGAYDNGVFDAVEKLLPTLDNFTRALQSVEDKDDGFYQGVSMIAKQLDEYLASLGVQAIDISTNFDPNLHHAVAHIEDEQYGQNVIIEELQKGYIYKGKVIRPSMVRVAN